MSRADEKFPNPDESVSSTNDNPRTSENSIDQKELQRYLLVEPSSRRMGLEIIGASAISGIIAQCIVHPLDTLRARLMVSQGGGLISSTRTLFTTSGPLGFYRGFGAAVSLQAPAVATHLSVYEWSKNSLSSTWGLSTDDPRVHLSAGVAAEMVSAVFWVPMEVVKQRAQVRGNAGSFVVLKDLLRVEGPRALLRGYGLTVGVYGPYSAIFFAVYEGAKRSWKKALGIRQDGSLPMKANLSAGALGGAVAGAVTTPLDVIKTRLQTQGDSLVVGERRLYKGTLHAATMIAREEGLRAFARGMGARVLWKTPGTAICMACYEGLKRNFGGVKMLQD